MSEMASGVLKGSRITLGEPYRLDEAPGAAGGAAAGPPATARIIEQSDGEAIVEIVCGCGSRIHLRCCHAEGPAGPAAGAKKD